MSIYDLVMLVVFAAAILFGLWKGLAWQVASLAAVFVSYFIAMTFRGQLAPFFNAEPPWNVFGAMLVLYLVTSLAIWIAFGYVRRSIERMHLKEFDRQAGALLGALKGALLCMVITMFAVTVASERVRGTVINSRSGNFIARTINQLSAIVPKELHQVLNPVLDRFNNRLNQPLQAQPAGAPVNQGEVSFFGIALTPNPQEVKGQFRLPVRTPFSGPTANNSQSNPSLNIDPQKALDAARNLIENGLKFQNR